MAGITSGGGGGYDYVESSFPDGAEEGESLYHITNDAAYVYTGAQWVEQTVTDHGQLSSVSEGDHRSDQRVSDLAPLQSVNGRTGDVSGLFEAVDYNPEADTHSRYTDGEASAAAPVQDVNGQDGSVSVTPGPSVVDSGTVSFVDGPRHNASVWHKMDDDATTIRVEIGAVDDSAEIWTYSPGDGPYVVSWAVSQMGGTYGDEIKEVDYKILQH